LLRSYVTIEDYEYKEHLLKNIRLNKINPLNVELNPICHLLAVVGAHPIFHVSRIRVNATVIMVHGKYICY
jgi:hypothetical protein